MHEINKNKAQMLTDKALRLGAEMLLVVPGEGGLVEPCLLLQVLLPV